MGNRIINPGEIKAQTSTMITSLQENNDTLLEIKRVIEDFTFEQELAGDAWEKGKQYMQEVVVCLTVDRILATIYCTWHTTTYAIHRMWVQFQNGLYLYQRLSRLLPCRKGIFQ